MNNRFKQLIAGLLSAAMVFSTPCMTFPEYLSTEDTSILREMQESKAIDVLAPEADIDSDSIIESGKCGDNLYWSIASVSEHDYDYTLTISGNGAMYDYLQEEYVFYNEIVTTAPWREYFNKKVKLVLEDGITRIGDNAFYTCSGFDKTIVIPDTVEEIGNTAFARSGFSGELTIPEAVKSIGYAAFMGNNFSGVLTIPASLVDIDEDVFAHNIGITKVINNSGCEINLYDIDGSEVYWVNDDGKVVDPIVNGTAYKKEGTSNIGKCGPKLWYEIKENPEEDSDYILRIYGTGKMYEYKGGVGVNTAPWKEYADKRIKIVFEEGITDIYGSPFRFCNLVGELHLPDSLRSIQGEGFNGCSGLMGELIIPQNMEYILMYYLPFGNCKGITKVTNLSKCEFNLDLMDSGALWKNEKGEYISILTEGSAEKVETNSLWGKCGKDVYYTIEENPTANIDYTLTISGNGEMYNYNTHQFELAPPWEDVGEHSMELVINSGVTVIGDGAFSYKGFVGDIVIPEGVKRIGQYSFSGRYGRGSFDGKLILPDSLEYIEYGAFEGLKKLKGELNLPQGLKVIESHAFCDCETLSGNLIIPDSMTALGNHIFAGCTGMQGKITIPDSVKDLKNDILTTTGNAESQSNDGAIFDGIGGDDLGIDTEIARDGELNNEGAGFMEVDNYNVQPVLLPQSIKWHWIDDSGRDVTEIATGTAKKIFNYCSLNYNSNGATSGEVPDSESVIKSDGIKIADNTGALSKEGYTFAGWNTKADGSGIHYDPEAVLEITSDTVLYAEWRVKKDSSSDKKDTDTSSSDKSGKDSSSDEKDTGTSSSRKSDNDSSSDKTNSSEDQGADTSKVIRITRNRGDYLIVGDIAEIKLEGIDPGIIEVKGKAGKYDKSTGNLTAIKKGTIKLLAPMTNTGGKVKKKVVCIIKVEQPSIASGIKVKSGKTKRLKIKGTKQPVESWTSKNPEIATVASDGKVTAVSAGETEITAAIGSHAYTCKVTVK